MRSRAWLALPPASQSPSTQHYLYRLLHLLSSWSHRPCCLPCAVCSAFSNSICSRPLLRRVIGRVYQCTTCCDYFNHRSFTTRTTKNLVKSCENTVQNLVFHAPFIVASVVGPQSTADVAALPPAPSDASAPQSSKQRAAAWRRRQCTFLQSVAIDYVRAVLAAGASLIQMAVRTNQACDWLDAGSNQSTTIRHMF